MQAVHGAYFVLKQPTGGPYYLSPF